MLNLQQQGDDVILAVRAQPGARRNTIAGVHAGALKVAITQAAEKGKANAAIIEVLSKAMALKRSQISILSGETSRQKRFRIAAIDCAELQRRLAAILND